MTEQKEHECKVGLTKLDTYPNRIIPDEDVEITLKVIRTLRDISLWPSFNADRAVLFSHTHAAIHDMVKYVQEVERNATSSEEGQSDTTSSFKTSLD